MLRSLVSCLVLSTLLSAGVCAADTDQPESTLSRAQRLSSLTGRGARPFHVKMKVSEPENPNSPYTAEIEESWLSSKQWTRTIVSPGFQQHLVVNGEERKEENVGGYYPIWLRSFVTALTDPLEDAGFWERISSRIAINADQTSSASRCARAQFKIGTPEVNNDAFAVICFNPNGTLRSALRPGYAMEFSDLRPFEKKQIAYHYVDNIETGTTLVGEIEELDSIDSPGPLAAPAPFDEATSHQVSGPIEEVNLSQEIVQQLAITPQTIVWPPVHSGNTSGKLSMYIAVDRDGHVREVYPLNSDNAGLQDAARDQILKWQLHPALKNGERLQVTAALTFQFNTTLEGAAGAGKAAAAASASTEHAKPIVISPEIASSLSLRKYPPVYPPDLKLQHISGKVELTAIIGEKGEIVSLTPLSSTNMELTEAALAAVHQWTFKPYLLNGAPVEIQTIITMNFNTK